MKANEQVYESLRPELERTCWGQWAVIVKGQLVAVAPTREEALRQAGACIPIHRGSVPPDALSRLVRKVGVKLQYSLKKQ